MNLADRRARQRARDFVSNYLAEHPCVDCGDTNSIVLAFDHLGDKRDNVSDMIRNGLSVDAIKAETAVCEVVCFNCHVIRTHERVGLSRWKRARGG